MSKEDNLWSGHPSTGINTSIIIITTVHDKDWCVMVRETEAETGIPRTAIHRILTEYLS